MGSLLGIFNALQVLLGLSFVILIHELGHFLLAKWNGVKVERFSIGFPPKLFSVRKGETEYVLGAVLLGGYVSMLGEGMDDEATKTTDPRAFPNKTVGSRMAIISAGVIMNLILGLVSFVYAYGKGVEERSARLGGVVAGAPAYAAGMRAGDTIVNIDDRREVSFSDILRKVKLSRANQVVHFELRRAGQDALVPIDVEPRLEKDADTPSIGIYPADSLTFSLTPYRAPAGIEAAPGTPPSAIKVDDTIIAAGPVGETPKPVNDPFMLRQLFADHADQPINIVIERRDKTAKPSPGGAASEQISVTLPQNRFITFGFRLKIEPISAIQLGSIADRAGFRKGDLILKVDGNASFDPMQLPTTCFKNAGKPMTFEVERHESGAGSEAKVVEITATPDNSPPWGEVPFQNEPLDVPGLGFAYPVRTTIAEVTPGSPADRAGLKAGDVINEMTVPGEKKEKKVEKPQDFKFNDKSPGWPSAFQTLQWISIRPVTLTVNNSNKLITITPEPDAEWSHPYRGTSFQSLTHMLPPMGPMAAFQRGLDDTVDNILDIYSTLRNLFHGRMGMGSLAGPPTIAIVAYDAASTSFTKLVQFLGILSINLAVLNFLPIPPLDGGQMVFLIAEKIRGRPVPDGAKVAGTWIGLVLVVGLMVFVLIQDVRRWL